MNFMEFSGVYFDFLGHFLDFLDLIPSKKGGNHGEKIVGDNHNFRMKFPIKTDVLPL